MIEHPLVDACTLGDFVDARAAEALLHEFARGGIKDRGARTRRVTPGFSARAAAGDPRRSGFTVLRSSHRHAVCSRGIRWNLLLRRAGCQPGDSLSSVQDNVPVPD